MLKTFKLALAASACLALCPVANAVVVLGDTITCSASGFSCSSPSATVTNASEFTLSGFLTSYSADFSSDGGLMLTSGAISLPLSLGSNTSISFTNIANPFANAVLSSATGLALASAAPTVQVNNGVMTINLSNVALVGTSRLVFTVATAAQAPAVPEPATWLTMLSGFGVIGYGLRSRRGVSAIT